MLLNFWKLIEKKKTNQTNWKLFFIPAYLLVSASFAANADANASRQRHAPLYGRLVAEEHLPPTHRDAVHQVSVVESFKFINVVVLPNYCQLILIK